MGKERQAGQGVPKSDPLQPFELPPALAEYLRRTEYAAVFQSTNQGTVMAIKVPSAEIGSPGGPIPIQLTHQLIQHPAAPVIRTVVRIYDQSDNPLALETYTNVEHEDMRQDFGALAHQKDLLLLFYDERLQHRRTIHVANTATQTVSHILQQAERLRASIPAPEYDFDAAKEAVMRATRL